MNIVLKKVTHPSSNQIIDRMPQNFVQCPKCGAGYEEIEQPCKNDWHCLSRKCCAINWLSEDCGNKVGPKLCDFEWCIEC